MIEIEPNVFFPPLLFATVIGYAPTVKALLNNPGLDIPKRVLNNFGQTNRGSLFSIGNPELESEVVKDSFGYTRKDSNADKADDKEVRDEDHDEVDIVSEELEAEDQQTWQGMD